MSVFTKIRQNEVKINHELGVLRQEKFINTEKVFKETLPCKKGHTWNGVVPSVDQSIMSVQNPDLIGKRCDCGSMLYQSEGECGCPSNKYWKIYFES